MEVKYCVFCGKENNTRSKMYCSQKCYNEHYYQKNQKELNEKHKQWAKENKEARKPIAHRHYLKKKSMKESETVDEQDV